MIKCNSSFSLIACGILMMTSITMGCQSKQSKNSTHEGTKVELKYAEHIQMQKYPLFTVVTLANPWDEGKVLHTYVLVNRKDSARVNHLPKGTLVYTPIERSVVFSTAHCKLLESLGALDAIAGVADLKYILIPAIQHRVTTGKIVDCGDGMSPNIERMIALHPQALLLSPFENSGGYGKLEGLGCPVIELADYMETSPLGRAEWMKFYGMLFGCEQRADSLFAVVDSAYQRLKSQAQSWSEGASLLTERQTGSVWYCPGGKSTIGQMIADAHGKYAFSVDKHSGSLALSFEEVLEKAGNSEVWAFKYHGEHSMTKQDLLAEYRGYRVLRAFKQGKIYGCNSRIKPYFEETPFRPDFLLRDIIIMLHQPHASCLGKLRYYEPLP
ncbi:ABC transporter substrate-binding protein [Prevotella sp. TCVGH]|uniref:ABC transporter substrate-binding protein n=1 Tax=Prevotella sp. TCVGH TaxID=2182433 RepID=UPI00201D9DA0|nr:ABC transporter substrate-binding protein [Prevotella sp. TCVGH]MCL6749310.1 ABC transporter substrate-binding protein [Prevotella sp. TCVGH]